MFKIMFKANKCFEDYFYNEARMACAEAKEYGWTEQEFGYLIEDMGDYLEITIFEKDMQFAFKYDYLKFTEGRILRHDIIEQDMTVDGFHITYERG